jgi:hypothetical protein
MWNFELVFVKHHETKSITLYSSRKMPKPKTYAYMYIYVHYYILPYINRFISICWIPLSISIHFLVYLEDTLSSRISPWQGAACSAVCYEIEMSPHGHFTFSLWNLEDTRCFPFSFCLACALPWVTPKGWRVPKISPPCLCLGQALISGTPYSSCDMHTIHKNSLIYIPDSYQASQYSPTWLMCQLPSTWLYASFN